MEIIQPTSPAYQDGQAAIVTLTDTARRLAVEHLARATDAGGSQVLLGHAADRIARGHRYTGLRAVWWYGQAWGAADWALRTAP